MSAIKEDVFEKPLVMKDFVKERKKKSLKRGRKGRLYERVRKTPESKRNGKQSKCLELVSAIAKEKIGTYKLLRDSIKADLLPKTAYPSIERLLMQIARRDGVDFSVVVRRPVQTKSGIRTNVFYTEYVKWKENNLKLRIIGNELFIEKKTDRPL